MKKIVSRLLIICIIITMLPMQVLAETVNAEVISDKITSAYKVIENNINKFKDNIDIQELYDVDKFINENVDNTIAAVIEGETIEGSELITPYIIGGEENLYPLSKDEIVELYDNGYSLYEIQKAENIMFLLDTTRGVQEALQVMRQIYTNQTEEVDYDMLWVEILNNLDSEIDIELQDAIDYILKSDINVTNNDDNYEDVYNEYVYPNAVYKKDITPPFLKSNEIEENINPSNGELQIKQTDIHLPGKRGLDLNITRLYNLSQANIYKPHAIKETFPTWGFTYDYVERKAYDGQNAEDGTFYRDGSGSYFFPTPSQANDKKAECDEPEWQFRREGNDSNGHYEIYRKYSTSSIITGTGSNIKEDRAKEKTCDDYFNIGVGWSFDFPFIEILDKYQYLHYGGGVYQFNATSSSEDSNLKDYPLNDIVLDKSSKGIDGRTAEWVLKDKNGKEIYFGSDGELLVIEDRYENKIKFEHDKSITGKPIIKKITDTVEREINFDYTDNQVTLTVNDSINPENNMSITYNKAEISHSDISDRYYLESMIDAEGRSTKYEYEIKSSRSSLKYKKDLSYGINNYSMVLSDIEYPTKGRTHFNYNNKSTKNCGNDGIMEFYKVVERYDYEKPNEESTNEDEWTKYNIKQFEYKYDNTLEYDGYSQYTQPSILFKNDSIQFDVKTKVTDSLNNSTIYTYNKKLLCTKIENEGLDHKTETINEYDLDKKLLLKTINKTYNKVTGNYIKQVVNYQYDTNGYGDLIGYWDVQTERDSEDMPLDSDNSKHKVTYEYNSVYHYPTKKTYYKDDNSKITEEYTPYSDNKSIQYAEVYENDILKSKVEYIYDSFGNVIEEKYYTKNDSGNWIYYSSTYYSYDDNDEERLNTISSDPAKGFNGAYLTRKWIENIQDIDGVTILAKGGNVPGTIDEVYKYDWYGNLIESVDRVGNFNRYEYDKLGRIRKQINSDNTDKQFIFDDVNNVITIKDEELNQIEVGYDKFGNLVYEKDVLNGYIIKEYEYYDDNFKLNTEKLYKDGKGVTQNGSITNYHYYTNGRLKKKEIFELIDSTLLSSEDYTYDEAVEDQKYTKITKTIKGDVNSPDIISSSYVDKNGLVVKQERVHEGQIYKDTFRYDYLGNKIEEKTSRAYDEGWSEAATVKYEYDFANRLTKQYNINGGYSSTEYDSLGRVIAQRDIKGNKDPREYSTTFTYDKLGRVIEEQIPFEDKDGTIHNTIKKYYYDRNGNVIKGKVIKNQVAQTEDYDIIEYQYNNRNQLAKITTYDNGLPENYTQYYYDAVGNKLRMYTALSKPLTINGLDLVTTNGDTEYSVTKYEYDQFGNLIKRIDPNNKSEFYEKYDYSGNLLRMKDRNENIVVKTYDGLNRLLTETVTTPDGTGNTSVSYTYTLTNNRKTMSSGGETTTYHYDDLGRLKEETAGNTSKEYTYDAGDNRDSFILKINGIVQSNTIYTYDKQNRLEEVKNNGESEPIASYTYDENGNRKTMTYENGVTAEYKYNLANSLTELSNKKGTSDLSKYIYTYFLNGNRATETETIAGTTRTREFQYDGLSRLKSESEDGTNEVTYDYDDNNNRNTKDASNPKTVEYLDDLLKATTYNYNGLNQFTNATIDNINVQYTYNGDGLRTKKIVNGITINNIWDGASIFVETDSSGNIISKFIRGINLIAVEKDNNRFYYLYNGHGDVVQLTDENGNIIKNYQYDSFGNEKNIDINDSNPVRYGGEYYDSETGFYYLRARYYDPRTGRFTTEDSYWGKAEDPLSLNLYTYCANNPIMYSDPSGHYYVYEGTSKTKGFTRGMARAFIGNPANAFVTQHPYLTEFFTGVPVADIFHIAGFDMVDGVWHSRPEAWQQIGGYNDIYDVIFDYATSMETDKFEFSSGERDYIFWAWKGDYLNLGAGAELGIYSNQSGLMGKVDVTSPISEHWLVDTSLAMPMTMSLKYKGNEIANYSKEHWWITSFNPFYQKVNESELSVIFTVDFTGNETLYNDFIKSKDYLDNLDKWSISEKNKYLMRYKFE